MRCLGALGQQLHDQRGAAGWPRRARCCSALGQQLQGLRGDLGPPSSQQAVGAWHATSACSANIVTVCGDTVSARSASSFQDCTVTFGTPWMQQATGAQNVTSACSTRSFETCTATSMTHSLQQAGSA